MTEIDPWHSEESRLRDCNIMSERTGDARYARTRATDRDRGNYQSRLDAAYAEGSITKEEHDARSDILGRSVLREHLSLLVSDLPAPYRRVAIKPSRWPEKYKAIPVPLKGIFGMIACIGQFLLTGYLTGMFAGHSGIGGNTLVGFSGIAGLILFIACLVGCGK